MKTVIVVRSCPDYLHLNEDKFKMQVDEQYKPCGELRIVIKGDLLNVWNRYFGMSFFQYRSGMAKIARENIKATNCSIVLAKAEFTSWLNDGEESLVVPVDDDDWFSPEIECLADKMDDTTQLICWNKTTFKNYNSSKFYDSGSRYRLASNNWAVKKSWLLKQGEKKAHEIVLGSHIHAHKYVEAVMDPAHVKVNEDHLGIYVRHIGSLALLQSFCANGILVESLKKLSLRVPAEPFIPEQFKWAEKWVRQSQSLGYGLRRKMMC